MTLNVISLLKADLVSGPRWGSALDWLLLATLILCALILICIAASQFFTGGFPVAGRGWWLSALGLVVIPIVLLPTANVTIIEYSRQVNFCGSCHYPMQPYIADMQKPDSRALAAIHYRDRTMPGEECYGCHADFGMHGLVQAKLTGLWDLYAFATGRYRMPLKSAAFSNQLCLKCHQNSRRFMLVDAHLESSDVIAPDLLSGDTRCADCHGPSHLVGVSSAPRKPAD